MLLSWCPSACNPKSGSFWQAGQNHFRLSSRVLLIKGELTSRTVHDHFVGFCLDLLKALAGREDDLLFDLGEFGVELLRCVLPDLRREIVGCAERDPVMLDAEALGQSLGIGIILFPIHSLGFKDGAGLLLLGWERLDE